MLQLEALEAQLDICNRIAEEHRGEELHICIYCYVDFKEHSDPTHNILVMPLSQIIIKLKSDIERFKVGTVIHL